MAGIKFPAKKGSNCDWNTNHENKEKDDYK